MVLSFIIMDNNTISNRNIPDPQSIARGAAHRDEMAAKTAAFEKGLFTAGFERDQAKALASALAKAGGTVNDRLLNVVDDTRSPYRELKASWKELEELLQNAQIGFFTRIGFAILDFFGQFFSGAKEEAQNFLLHQTASNRKDFLQSLAMLIQDLDPDRYQSTPEIGEALAAKRDLLLKGLVSTLIADYPANNGAETSEDSLVSWILDKYQLDETNAGLMGLLKEGHGLLLQEAKAEEPAAKIEPMENEAPLPSQKEAETLANDVVNDVFNRAFHAAYDSEVAAEVKETVGHLVDQVAAEEVAIDSSKLQQKLGIDERLAQKLIGLLHYINRTDPAAVTETSSRKKQIDEGLQKVAELINGTDELTALQRQAAREVASPNTGQAKYGFDSSALRAISVLLDYFFVAVQGNEMALLRALHNEDGRAKFLSTLEEVKAMLEEKRDEMVGQESALKEDTRAIEPAKKQGFFSKLFGGMKRNPKEAPAPSKRQSKIDDAIVSIDKFLKSCRPDADRTSEEETNE